MQAVTSGNVVGPINQKGGVGKTTLTGHLAYGLAQHGLRVIVVDADPQGNATSWLLNTKDKPGVYQWLVAEMPVETLLVPAPAWGVQVLPGNALTGQALLMLAAVQRLTEITVKLRALAALADVVLVDTPPSRLPGFLELLAGMNYVLVPTIPERHSLEGIQMMAAAARELGERGPRLMGIVPNRVDARTREHKAQMADLIRVFGKAVWPPLPATIRFAEASAQGTTVFDLCAHEELAERLWSIVQRVEEVLRNGKNKRK